MHFSWHANWKRLKQKKQSLLLFRLLILLCLVMWVTYLPIWPENNPARAVVSFIPANQIITYSGLIMKIGDINGDSKQDIVLGDRGYVNTSSVWTLIQSNFGPTVGAGVKSSFNPFPIYNVNNSGYNDYVEGGGTSGWFKNNYSSSAYGAYVLLVSSIDPDWYYGDSAGNLDGDSYTDFVRIHWVSTSNIKIEISECDNNNCEYPGVTSYIIDNSFLFAGNHRCQAFSIIKDFNNDSSNDILVGAGGLARFYTNAGSFSFTSTTYVDGTDCGYHYPTTGDIDGDGYQDLVYFNYTGDIVYWRQNDQNPGNGFGTQYILDNTLTANAGEYFSDNILTASSSAYVKDIDGDSDNDIAIANGAGNAVYWYENDSTPADGGWTRHTVDNNISAPSGVAAEDFNNDGLIDIVASNASGVYFYAHNNPPALQSISAIASTTGSGYVNVSLGVGDVELGETKLKILYKAGADCSAAVSSTTILADSVSATYNDTGGAPLLNNSFSYQIGSSTSQAVITSPSTNTVQFVWDSKTDVPTANGTYCLAMVANDSYGDSTTSTVSFTLDNLAPTAPGTLTTSTIATSSAVLAFGATTTETNFDQYKIFYKAGASGVGESDTAFTSSTDADLGNILFNGTANTTVTGLLPNTQYAFNIWAYDTYGNKASSTQELSFYTDAVVPGAPTVTASTTSATSLTSVIDQNSNGATTEYRLCKTTDGLACDVDGYVQTNGTLGAVSSTWQTYTTWGGAGGISITGLNSNTNYAFLAQARNASQAETSLSAPGNATTLASAVTDLLATNTTNTTTLQLQLTWTDASSTGLKIEQDNSCNGSYDQTLYDQTTATATQPYVVTSTISADTCYRFRVSSYNASSTLNSSIAPTVDITTPPGQGTGLTTSAITTSSITWVWNAVANAVGYYLFNNLSGSLIADVIAPTVEYLQDSLTNNTQYSAIIRAYNASGTGIASSAATVYTGAGAPTGVQLSTSTASSITWQWNDSSQSGFFAQDKDTPVNNSGWLGAGTTSWQETGLATNTSYTVQVKAKNESDVETSWSEASGYTTQAAPTGITFVSSTETAINIQAAGTFYNLGGSAVVHFDNGAGATADITSGNSWENTLLTPNTQYTYTVLARNTAGIDTASVQLATYTLANIPASPVATADSYSQITFSWATNSNPAGTEYYAENITAGTNSGWITNITWASTGLTANTSYTFRVKARNGNSIETGWSSEISATTNNQATGCTSGCGPGTPPPLEVVDNSSVIINDGVAETSTSSVNLKISSNSAAQYALAKAYFSPYANGFVCESNLLIDYQQFADPTFTTFTLRAVYNSLLPANKPGTYGVCVKFKKANGEVVSKVDTISLQGSPSGSIIVENNQSYTQHTLMQLLLSPVLADEYALSSSSDFSAASFRTINSEETGFNWSFDFGPATPEGLKTVFARFRNQFGVYDISDTVIFDRTWPLLDSDSLQVDTGIVGGMRVGSTKISGLVSDANLNGIKAYIQNIPTRPNGFDISSLVTSSFYAVVGNDGRFTLELPQPLPVGDYVFNIWAKDGAGNPSYTVPTKLFTISDQVKDTCSSFAPDISRAYYYLDYDGQRQDAEDIPIDGTGQFTLVANSDQDLDFTVTKCPYFYFAYDGSVYPPTTKAYFNTISSPPGQGKALNWVSSFGLNDTQLTLQLIHSDIHDKLSEFGSIPGVFYVRFSYTLNGVETFGNEIKLNLETETFADYCAVHPDDYSCGQDTDGDGIINSQDNCPSVGNANQLDSDGDGLGDACDIDQIDTDQDGVPDKNDNCPNDKNADQLDTDKDGLGNVCDRCLYDALNDSDGDLICGNVDNCPIVKNQAQTDYDNDGVGNACDLCPNDATNIDPDKDGFCAVADNCPEVKNADQKNSDSDQAGDACDACPKDALNDLDKDGVCGDIDNCPTVANANQSDANKNGKGDVCENLPDADGDKIPDLIDNCVNVPNFNQENFDSDGSGNACDICPQDALNDIDKDGVCGNIDNCPSTPNPVQADSDSDGIGNACDNKVFDIDQDGIPDNLDNCPITYNPNQSDADGDQLGNVCDVCPSDSTNHCSQCTGLDCDNGEDTADGEDGDNSDSDGSDESVISIISGMALETAEQVGKFFTEFASAMLEIKTVRDFVNNIYTPTVEAVKVVIDNPQVEKINENYFAPALAVAGASNVAVGFELPQLVVFFRSLFGQPLILLRRRKQRQWGVIYDAFTKQPLDLAAIRVIDPETNQVIRSQVTDSRGRYYLVLEPGKYKLEIAKSGYSGFSEYLSGTQEDSKYINLYHGEVITIKDSAELNYNIPLDSASATKNLGDIIKDKTAKFSKYIFGLTGLVASGFSFIISPTPLVSTFFFGHLFFFGITYRLAYTKIPTSFGAIKDKKTQKPLANVVIRIFDAQYNKLVASVASDKKGRYALLVGPSKYYVTFEKAGYKIAKLGIIDFSSGKTSGMGGMIKEKVELEEGKNV